MARIVPDGWREWSRATLAAGSSPAADTLSARRQHDLLELLAAALPEAYSVYHGVHWTAVDQGFSVYGEIDFVIVNLDGDLLLLMHKTGLLDESGQALLKRERGRMVDLRLQIIQTVDTLQSKLARRPGCESVRIDYLLHCPDYTVRHPESAGLSADRLVDAARRDHLVREVMRALPPAREKPVVQAGTRPMVEPEAPEVGNNSLQRTAVERFLRDVIELQPDVSALVGQAQALITRVSGGLAHWARQLELNPHRLRVQATAGSGKTQLALAEHVDAIARGERVLHVCFNRPLADHFARIAPPGGEVMTFHGLCQQLLREAGQPLPAPGPGRFEALEAQALALMPVLKPRYDTLVVDEGQDFSQPWCDLLMCLAHPKARVLWLDDPMQALYPRAPAALLGWPVLRAQTNHRSPREIVEWLRVLLPEDQRIESASPLASGGLELIAYGDRGQPPPGVNSGLSHEAIRSGPVWATDAFETVQVATREAVRRCLAAGFRRQDIAVISFHGRAQSALLSLDSLGTHAVRRFTGRHDLLDQPVYTEGGLLFESVYRFKGQAAPAVVLTEIDFRALDAMALRKLFVGATRATIKLVLVAAPAAAQVIGEAMQRSQP
jgi:hypothetical protein